MISIKVCCIKSIDEAVAAIAADVQAIGLVSEMPSGPGVISEQSISDILAAVPSGVETFLLTSLTQPQSIASQHARCPTSTIQLCSPLEPHQLAELRALLPSVSLVPVIHVAGPESIDAAINASELADSILLDTGSSSAELVELGGTGRTHDWTVSAQIVAESTVPVYLAGGLTPTNIDRAIQFVRPFGVDVCTGVRDNDSLSIDKLKRFVERVRRV